MVPHRIRIGRVPASAGVRRCGRAPVLSALLVLACLPACLVATPDPGIPLPPTEAQRAAFGPVAVSGPETGHVVTFEPPPGVTAFGVERAAHAGGETAAAAAVGTQAAAIGGVAAGSEAVCGLLALSAGSAVALVVVPAIVVGVIVCAATAPAAEDLARVFEAVVRAVGDAAESGDLTDAFVAAARREAGVVCVPPESARTRIEVAIDSAALKPGRNPAKGSHGAVVSVTGRARVVRAADGAVVHELRLTAWARTPPLEWNGWSAPGGAPARAVVQVVLRRLAVALVEEIFLLDRSLVAPRWRLR